MKRFSWLLLTVLMNSAFLFSQLHFQTDSGIEVDLKYRTLEPGEVLLTSITGRIELHRVQIHFLGKTFNSFKKQNSSSFLSLVGIDMEVKPGEKWMALTLEKKRGETEYFSFKIEVSKKEFPLKSLQVKEEYVTPPRAMLERIRREAALLKRIYSSMSDAWMGESSFVIPADGRAMQNFGERRIFNNKPRSSHSGVDISGPLGAPVRAANTGNVVLARDLYFSGGTVIIDHGLGVFSLYCHFSAIRVEEGKSVEKGEVIGEIGATGRVTGPHLHWGVRIAGTRVDPFSLLSLEIEEPRERMQHETNYNIDAFSRCEFLAYCPFLVAFK